jgi:hypothetical protein
MPRPARKNVEGRSTKCLCCFAKLLFMTGSIPCAPSGPSATIRQVARPLDP